MMNFTESIPFFTRIMEYCCNIMNVKGVFRNAFYTAFSVYTLAVVNLWCCAVNNDFNTRESQRIKDKAQIEQIVEDELAKHGKYGKKITVRVDPNAQHEGRYVALGDDEYEIILSNEGYNIATLKHELFHIMDGHADNSLPYIIKFLSYAFYEEPRASYYAMVNNR